MEVVRLLYRIGGDEKLSHRYFPGQPYTTDVLTEEQMAYIATQLPQPHATTGRPAYTNLELLPGILRVLRSGCRWRDLNLPGYPDGSTHWRRLRLWRKGLHFRWIWKRILKLLEEQNPEKRAIEIKRLSIDGTLLTSFAFKERSGYSGKHRRVGVKASILVDATGLPLAVDMARGNAHDTGFSELTCQQALTQVSTRYPMKALHHKGLR
jgi:transposase